MVKVCIVGAFRGPIGAFRGPDQLQNPVIRPLEAAGVKVKQVYIPPVKFSACSFKQYGLFKTANWLRQQINQPRISRLENFDAFVVAWPAFYDIAWVKKIARRYHRPLLYYAFIPFFETYAVDRHYHKNNWLDFFRFKIWRQADLNMAQADVIIMDTKTHADYLARQYQIPRQKIKQAWVGSNLPDQDVDAQRPACASSSKRGKIRALYFGYFAPLHGVEYIVKAAKILKGQAVEFKLIGQGQTLIQIRAMLSQLNLKNVEIAPPVRSNIELVREIENADIGLGIFGHSPKTRRVIPFKVFDMFKCGLPVITGDTPAVRELITPGQEAGLVPPANAAALAQAISTLAKDPAKRVELGEKGRRLYQQALTPQKIGEQIKKIIAEYEKTG